MAESLLRGSQSCLLLRTARLGPTNRACPTRVVTLRLQQSLSNGNPCRGVEVSCFSNLKRRRFTGIGFVSSDSEASTVITDSVNYAGEGADIKSDVGGGGDGFRDNGGNSGGGGGGSGRDDSKNEGEGGSSDESPKKMALSMSQKLTLGYAALVGVGGVMGYMKSGSQKSLLAGGLSAGLLYYVYTQLPSNPVFASSLGLGVSAILLGVMGSRFRSSGKIFPAGVVSLVSLVMTGGYLHGILRSAH
ncbi:protein FATTY ACID EXPORT 2, chloroplastic-like [Tripterygium wilfordii]|uniref:protein FATTY ACID EXPORT 2, chloroplastic-like n=1 Tax=Tripterygium wilfordii TaxID=458696 RepID=UPI0018F80686|nr:protein FATTY ACID EXPORT 2, chloroplastic-like [Tripterygium wilfordii]